MAEVLKIVKTRSRNIAPKSNIKLLRDSLDSIESGKVTMIAVIGLNCDGSMFRGWGSSCVKGDNLRLLGAMDVLKEDFINSEFR